MKSNKVLKLKAIKENDLVINGVEDLNVTKTKTEANDKLSDGLNETEIKEKEAFEEKDVRMEENSNTNKNHFLDIKRDVNGSRELIDISDKHDEFKSNTFLDDVSVSKQQQYENTTGNSLVSGSDDLIINNGSSTLSSSSFSSSSAINTLSSSPESKNLLLVNNQNEKMSNNRATQASNDIESSVVIERYGCNFCGTIFNYTKVLYYHRCDVKLKNGFLCLICHKYFDFFRVFRKHKITCSVKKNLSCSQSVKSRKRRQTEKNTFVNNKVSKSQMQNNYPPSKNDSSQKEGSLVRKKVCSPNECLSVVKKVISQRECSSGNSMYVYSYFLKNLTDPSTSSGRRYRIKLSPSKQLKYK